VSRPPNEANRLTRAALGLALVALFAVGPLGCLARSASRGDVEGVKRYLAEGDSPDSRDIRRRSAMELAIILKHPDVVDVLIEAGADVNRRGYRGRTPLNWASSRFGTPDLIRTLIAGGADPDGTDHIGQTPLLFAVADTKPEHVRTLLENGADVNKIMSPKWKSPVLNVAVQQKKPGMVQMLVAAGADPDANIGRNKSARQLAGRNSTMLYAIDQGLQQQSGGGYAAVPRPAPAPRPAPPRVAPRPPPPPRTQSAAVNPRRTQTHDPRTTAHTTARIGADLRFGRYYALVIGNNEYRHLPPLETAVNDARAFGEVLERRYGYEVTTLFNATRSEILQTLTRFRRQLREDDNLIIYYAGHGWLDEDEDRGYWLPVDATQTDDVHWIPNESITSKTKAMDAKHVMVIADSCYSGKLVRGIHVNTPTPNYLKKLATRRARVVLTSGGIEPVSDAGGRNNHSVFASALLDVLNENQDVLEGHELFTRIRRPVAVNSDQIPEYSDIRKAGHDGGDFLFIPK